MTYISKFITSSLLAGSLILSAATTWAQDAPSRFLIEETALHPGKAKKFTEGWKTVLKHADKHDYPYNTFVSRSGPRISVATPLSDYADLDNMIAERNRIFEAGGSDFADAIKNMDAASYSSSSFVAIHQPEISNGPMMDEMDNYNMFEISTASVQPGKADQFKAILTTYKNRLGEHGLLDLSLIHI